MLTSTRLRRRCLCSDTAAEIQSHTHTHPAPVLLSAKTQHILNWMYNLLPGTIHHSFWYWQNSISSTWVWNLCLHCQHFYPSKGRAGVLLDAHNCHPEKSFSCSESQYSHPSNRDTTCPTCFSILWESVDWWKGFLKTVKSYKKRWS